MASRLRLSINRLHRLLRQESLAGLSPAQASALGAVNRLGSPTLGELAAIEQVQPPTMTKIVASLADAGMVTRVTDAADRRSARVRITPAGKRSMERIRTLKNAFLTRRLAELSPEEQAGAAGAGGAPRTSGGPMSRLAEAGHRTFRALSVRNYRLFFTGQVISVSGTWMQMVAQTYLILFRLHGTGVDVAIATGLQFVPLLLLGPFGGLIADRLDKRKVLYATQSSAAVLALALGLLVITHSIHLWQVFVLAALLGVVNLFDNPARQTFVSEMVGRDLLPNAVSLNSVVMNGARVIGPAIGGVLILTLGVSTCFIVNAASYVAVIVALSRMRTADLYSTPGVGRSKGQVREGLRYVWSTPDLRSPLISMAVVGVFAFNFTVTLPLLAKVTFHGGAGLYSCVPGRHGCRRGGRRALHRTSQPPVDAPAGRDRPLLRRLHRGGGARAHQAGGPRAPGPHGGRQHLVRRHQQRHLATALRSRHAGPGHVPQCHRLLGEHADRRTPARLHQRRQQSADRTSRRRYRHPGGQRAALLRGHPPACRGRSCRA